MHHYFFQSMKSLRESFTFIGASGLMVLKMRLKETIQKQVREAWVTEVHWLVIIDVGCEVEVIDAELEAARVGIHVGTGWASADWKAYESK